MSVYIPNPGDKLIRIKMDVRILVDKTGMPENLLDAPLSMFLEEFADTPMECSFHVEELVPQVLQ
jgi:hypothetical protein